ncbi:unnamed protein product [Peronospora belbahrii]|uniref:Uncharacterized protein n=1 Tax=Peronospora belbahrii TaxID=622444 RepID=A0AAU9L6S7_9STRA|nr:unnamed protein product [Peronospora belbahrii]CAH0521653.1 unnamed protein product [Peronospora belbahrii]
MTDMEVLLIRIDHFRDRIKYISILRTWLLELQIINGRIITMGSNLHFLFVVALETQNSQLLEFYRSRVIDINNRGEPCVDKFIDVLGRKKVSMRSSCKGFTEMNVLSPILLQKVLVQEWKVEQEWVDTALASTRTMAFLKWRDAAKAARRERRKRNGQLKQQERDAKRIKQEKDVMEKKQEEAHDDDVKEEKSMTSAEDCKQQPLKEQDQDLKGQDQDVKEQEQDWKEEDQDLKEQEQNVKPQPLGQKKKTRKKRNKKQSVAST